MTRKRKRIRNFLIIAIFLILLLTIVNTVFADTYSESQRNKILNDKDTWIKGYYYSWGGAFTESTSSYCTENPLYIEPGTYYVATNDSRIRLAIQQYKEDGSWINAYKGGLGDGNSFEVVDSAAYIMVTISSTQWNMDVLEYFDYGLTINILSEYTPDTMEKADLATTNLNDTTLIKTGIIVTDTGKPALSPKNAYYNKLFYVDDTKYVINLPSSSIRLTIIEYDEDDNAIESTTISAGRTWQKQETTSYIAINITYNSQKVTNGYTYDEYIEFFKNYKTSIFTKYEKYVYSTDFDTTFTAYDFATEMNIGWNLGDSLESSYCKTTGEDQNLLIETSWGNPYVTKDLIDYVAAQGFNTIRIPVTWYPNCAVDEDGHYTIGKEWLSRVQDVVNYAIEDNMYVMINTMYDEDKIFYVGVSDEDTWAGILQSAKEIWTQIAEYFKDYDEHLIFESYNEVGTQSGWAYSALATKQINELNQVFTDAVRATGGNNSYRLLMVPTYTTSSKDNVTGDFVLPTDTIDGRIMVSVHVYAANYDEDIEWVFEQLEKFSIRIDAPIVIGEFGMNTKSTFQDIRAIHMSNYLARATKHGIKCIIWDDDYNWQLVDRWNFSNSRTDLIKAMFEGYNNGTAYKTVKNKIYFNDINQFLFGGLNLSTGDVTNTDYSTAWWGGLIALNEDRTSTKIEIPDDTSYIVMNLKTTEDAAEVWLIGIIWYDEDGNYLSYIKGQEIGSRFKTLAVPEGAKYYTIGFNDPYKNHNVEAFGNWLKAGNIGVNLTYISNNLNFMLEKETVNVKDYNYIGRTIEEATLNKSRENLDDCDLTNKYNWTTGSYSSTNGSYVQNPTYLCLKDYKTVEAGTEYTVSLTGGEDYSLTILALDEDMNYIGVQKNLSNGDTYTIADNVKYITAYLYNVNKITYSSYMAAFDDDTLSVDLINPLSDNGNDNNAGDNGDGEDNGDSGEDNGNLPNTPPSNNVVNNTVVNNVVTNNTVVNNTVTNTTVTNTVINNSTTKPTTSNNTINKPASNTTVNNTIIKPTENVVANNTTQNTTTKPTENTVANNITQNTTTKPTENAVVNNTTQNTATKPTENTVVNNTTQNSTINTTVTNTVTNSTVPTTTITSNTTTEVAENTITNNIAVNNTVVTNNVSQEEISNNNTEIISNTSNTLSSSSLPYTGSSEHIGIKVMVITAVAVGCYVFIKKKQ